MTSRNNSEEIFFHLEHYMSAIYFFLKSTEYRRGLLEPFELRFYKQGQDGIGHED